MPIGGVVSVYKVQALTAIFWVVIVCLFHSGCKKRTDSLNGSCPIFELALSATHDKPIWHPSGSFIGFNYTPLREVKYTYGYDCPFQAKYTYKSDSVGFWLIDQDGGNLRKVLPYTLITPSWSADGKWIAYSQNGQIFKMPFDGRNFDENAAVQVTTTGNNHSPTWSRDGLSIAHAQSVCSGSLKCGLWITNNMGSEHLVLYGTYPAWDVNSENIGYFTTAIASDGNIIGNSLWMYSLLTRKSRLIRLLSLANYDNRSLKISPDGLKLGFISQASTAPANPQLYSLNVDGSGLSKLTNDGAGDFSWSPDSRIVYTNLNPKRIDENTGVLWTMDKDGTNKKQLTKNYFNTIK